LHKSKPDNDAENEQQVNATPKAKTKLILCKQRVSTNVKRMLLFHNTLVAAMQERSRITKMSTDKHMTGLTMVPNVPNGS